jgi:hypothetical protein
MQAVSQRNVEKSTDGCKHRFGAQLLQNPPICSSTVCNILKYVSQGLEKSVEMENLVLPLKDVSDQVRPFLNQELKEKDTHYCSWLQSCYYFLAASQL